MKYSALGTALIVLGFSLNSSADAVFVQRTIVNQAVSVNAVDRRIGDVAVARWNQDKADRKIRIQAEKAKARAEKWIKDIEIYGNVKAGNPFFPHNKVSSASDMLQLAKEANEIPAKSVMETLDNWNKYSF